MKHISIPLLVISVLAISVLTYSCSSQPTTGEGAAADTVATAVIKLADTTSFKKANGDVCTIYAEATFNYPTAYADQASLAKLQQLYSTSVLEAPDSLTLADAMQQCVASSLHQYDFTTPAQADYADYADEEALPVTTYHTSSSIQVCYNRNGLLTLCRIDVVKKDSTVTSVTHRYSTFDLKRMALVELRDLVRDDAVAEVTKLLRQRLLEQNNVQNTEQLNELGYFNVDNLTATRNFCFEPQGVTWSFQPNELAVNAVGEPRITLTYEALSPLACDGSVLERLY